MPVEEMNQPSSLLVEFYGPPGVGKSTIAKQLHTSLRKHGYKTTNKTYENSRIDGTVPRNLNKFKYIFQSHKTGLSNSRRLYNEIKQTNQPKRSQLLNLFLYSHFLRGTMQSVHGTDGIHLFDQGVVQLCWAIQYSGTESFSPTALFEQYPSFDEHVVVHVTVDPDTVFDRLINRDDGRSRIERQEMTKQTVEAVIDDVQSRFEVVGTHPGLTGLTVQNNTSIEKVSKQLLDKLNDLGIIET